MKILLPSYLSGLLFLSLNIYADSDPFNPSFPTPPPDYEILNVGKVVADASVNFNSSNLLIGQTNGYIVTDPDGNTFVVDNIDKPTYAFYGNYIETNDNLTVFDPPEINTQVYVEEINFNTF